MNPWSHLPNADHIDWVIRSLKINPNIWARAWNATWAAPAAAAWWEARDRARAAIIDADLETAWYAAYDASCNTIRDAARDTTYDTARNTAHNVILTLVVYDDCDQYLAMTYERLLTYAILSEKPQSLLLLPMKWVQENETMGTAT